MDAVTGMLFLGYCLFIRRFIRWPIESLPILLISFIIVLFYIFAYAHFLDVGSNLFMLIGAILLISSPLYLYKERKKLFSDYLTPGIVFFIIFLLIYKHISHGFMIVTGDELGRWVPHIRFVNLHDRFWGSIDNLNGEQDYPPGGALLNYFFLKLPGFAEKRLFFIEIFLLSCPFIVLFRQYRWHNLFTAAILAYFLLKLFSSLLGIRLYILMDQPAGLFFGGILASYYLLIKEKYLWIYLCIVASAFLLFKPMLYPFLLLCSSVIFIDQLFLRIVDKKSLISIINNIVLLATVPALFLFSWNYYIGQQYPDVLRWGLLSWHSSNSLSSDQTHLVIINFLKKVPLIIIFYIALASCIAYFFIPDRLDKKRLIVSQCLLLCGYIGFLISVLLTYLSKFVSDMAIELNAFSRFVSIYQLGWMLAVIGQILSLIKIPKLTFNGKYHTLNKYITIIKFSIVLILIAKVCYSIHIPHKRAEIARPLSAEYEHYMMKQVADGVKQLTNESSTISLIWEGGGAGVIMQLMLNYELFPRQTKLNFLFNTDSSFSVDRLIVNTLNVDYMLIGFVDPVFWQRYGAYFQGRKPLTVIKMCMQQGLSPDPFNLQNCKMQDIPIYLYKVTHEHGEPKMIQV